MKQVNLYEAKTQLSRLIQEAIRGEEIVIAKNGEPQVKLVPVRKVVRSDGFGWTSEVGMKIDWDKFNAPLDEFEEYT